MHEIARHYAPTGELRVALNHGNRILVGRKADGSPYGISVDLAHAVATEIGAPLRFVEYERAVDVSNSASGDAWDVCFLAVDPKRAEVLDFTAPYVRIKGCYLAGPDCRAVDAKDLVDSKAAVGTVDGSAYTLTLSRLPGAERLVTYPDIHAMLRAFDAGEVQAVAGIGDVMAQEAKTRPGTRVLAPPFMEIRQAMAIVQGRPEAATHLQTLLATMARDGRVGDILERHGVSRSAAFIPD